MLMPNITQARFKALSASAMGVPMAEFLKLTKMPIVLYYGDYIQVGSDNVGEDKWGMADCRARSALCHGRNALRTKVGDPL